MKVRAVIFDLDGPILDSFRDGLRRIRRVCAVYDIPFNRTHTKKLQELWGIGGVELFVQGVGVSVELAKETLYPAWERLDIAEPPQLVLHAREALAWLRRNKIVATLLTSREGPHVTQLLDRLDLAREFSVVSTKFSTKYRKPDPRVFGPTLEELKDKFAIVKEECVFVGDTPADIDAGAKVGIETLLVQTGPYLLKHAKELPLALANVLNSVDDLPGWIEEHHEGEELLPYE